ATLNVEPLATGAAKSAAKLVLDGKLGAVHINVATAASGELNSITAADLRVDGLAESDDGSALAALLGMDRAFNVDRRPARLALAIAGNAGGDLRIDGKMTSVGFESSTAGTLRLVEQGLRGNLDVVASATDVTALHRDAAMAIPVTVKTKV